MLNFNASSQVFAAELEAASVDITTTQIGSDLEIHIIIHNNKGLGPVPKSSGNLAD